MCAKGGFAAQSCCPRLPGRSGAAPPGRPQRSPEMASAARLLRCPIWIGTRCPRSAWWATRCGLEWSARSAVPPARIGPNFGMIWSRCSPRPRNPKDLLGQGSSVLYRAKRIWRDRLFRCSYRPSWKRTARSAAFFAAGPGRSCAAGKRGAPARTQRNPGAANPRHTRELEQAQA